MARSARTTTAGASDVLGELGGDFFLPGDRSEIRKTLGDSLIAGRFAAKGTCDHCGAWFKFGMVYRHTSGVAAVVGNTCAEKSLSVDSRYTLVLNRARAKVEAATKAAQARAEADKLGFAWLYSETHVDRILTDIAAKGLKFGSITARQLDLVKRIHDGTVPEYQVKRDERLAQREAERLASNYQGEAGKPITVALEVVARTERDGYMPNTVNYWHLLKSTDGHFFTYSGSSSLGVRGVKFTGTFTVKAHEEYKGTKQTKLARPRKVVREDGLRNE